MQKKNIISLWNGKGTLSTYDIKDDYVNLVKNSLNVKLN